MKKKYLAGSLILYIFLVVIYYLGIKNYAIKNAEASVKELLENYQSFRAYSMKEQKKGIKELQDKGILHQDYFSTCLLSTSYNSDDEGKSSIAVGFVSDNPRNPTHKGDPFELEILKRFNQREIKEYKEIRKSGTKEILFYAMPTKVNSKECMSCHSDPSLAPKDIIDTYGDKNGFGEKVGKIRGLIKAEYSLDRDLLLAQEFFFFLSISTLTFFIILIFVVTRFLNELHKRANSLESANQELTQRYQELKRKDKLLIKQSKLAAMGEMIGVIAHQWKQPLNTLNLMVEDIEDAYLENYIDKKYMQDFKKNAYKKLLFMSRTIDDFRDFFRPNKERTSFDLRESIEEVVNILRPALEKEHIALHLTGKSIFIEGVKGELEQVILNIINNAKEAYIQRSIEEREISITIEESKNTVEIKISDNAGGIEQEYLEKIFDSYFSTKGSEGTGIGLYMAKMIIEDSLRGEIKGYNREKGAVFSITLPKEFSS